MKLNLLPARTGAAWARAGIRLFMRYPLAMIGLFFMFMATLSVVAMVPAVGGVLGLVLVPGLTLGMMAAAREAEQGRFPLPRLLFSAFLQGAAPTRRMLLMGAAYAACVAAALAASAVADGGRFAAMYTLGTGAGEAPLKDPAVRTALWVFLVAYAPISAAFWHAPALMHWHGVPLAKSIFFSAVAVLRNAATFLVYAVMWFAVSAVGALLVMVLAAISGNAAIARIGLMPVALAVGSMLFASLWQTFSDSFTAPPPTQAQR